jgi:hypothetical protein
MNGLKIKKILKNNILKKIIMINKKVIKKEQIKKKILLTIMAKEI